MQEEVMNSAIYGDYDRYRDELRRRRVSRISARAVAVTAGVALAIGVVLGPVLTEASRDAAPVAKETPAELPNEWRWKRDVRDFDHMFRSR